MSDDVRGRPGRRFLLASYLRAISLRYQPRIVSGVAIVANLRSAARPLDFIARLAALIPPPNFHMVRYHGVLAAHAKARSEVVPGPAAEPSEPTQMPLPFEGNETELEVVAKRASRHPWPWLLQRVFAVDIMVCPRCRGKMRLVEIANKRDDIARVLADVGLGPRPPPRPRPTPPGQRTFDFAA